MPSAITKSSSVMRRTAACLASLIMLGAATLARAQTAATGSTAVGTLVGTVRATPTGVALPYAVVSIAALRLERFSGANGQFVLPNVPVGTHTVTVRRIGFVPQQLTVTIIAGGSTRLDPMLTQIPVRLTAMNVRPAEPCKTPGLPDATKFPEVAQLVGLLRENAATARTLATQHPYSYAQYRALGSLVNDEVRLTSVVAERMEGMREVRYRPGRIVTTTGRGSMRSSVMTLPTILDLADQAFIDNHCFRYGGISVRAGEHGDETWVRLDVRASDKLRSPDVHGVFYLDSATAQLRRMELDLSRTDRLPGTLRSIRAVQATTTFLEIAPGLSVIDNVCGINWLQPSRDRLVTAHPAELQHVAAVQFGAPPPDVPALRDLPPPAWVKGGRVARTTLSCAELP